MSLWTLQSGARCVTSDGHELHSVTPCPLPTTMPTRLPVWAFVELLVSHALPSPSKYATSTTTLKVEVFFLFIHVSESCTDAVGCRSSMCACCCLCCTRRILNNSYGICSFKPCCRSLASSNNSPHCLRISHSHFASHMLINLTLESVLG